MAYFKMSLITNAIKRIYHAGGVVNAAKNLY